MIKLSIITATTPERSQWATAAMEQIAWQRRNCRRSEHLLVCDGSSSLLRGRAPDCHCRYIEIPDGPHRDYGATAHQRGLESARGEYVVFWDDDNVYYPHAVETALKTTARLPDLAILQVRHYGDDQRFRVLPAAKLLQHGDIDTLCLVVRRRFALRASWIDDQLGERGSDWRWLTRLRALKPRVAWVPITIGAHT